MSGVSSFAELKKRTAEISKGVQEGTIVGAGGKQAREEDPRFWYPKLDEEGVAYAEIRFLPPTKGESLPWVTTYKHDFKTADGKNFIENCPTSIGLDCPICTANKANWNSGVDSDKKVASHRKRKTTVFTNVLVLKDPATPENVGTVRILRMGSMLFEMITGAAKPKFADDLPVDAFDPFEAGATFKLKIFKEDGQVKYSKSGFEKPSRLGTDEFIEEIWNKQHKLMEFLAPENFKSFEQIEERFNRFVLNKAAARTPAPGQTEKAPEQRAERVDESAKAEPAKVSQSAAAVTAGEVKEPGAEAASAMDFFKDLAERA